MTRDELYAQGKKIVFAFLDHNLGFPYPVVTTYNSAERDVKDVCILEFFRRATRRGLSDSARGRYTGLYYRGHIFVNVPVTALPVQTPVVRSWSWPGWKTDRTAVGVLAHEVGHYLAHATACRTGSYHVDLRRWRGCLATNCKKPVSGYEPTADEAWAETMKLFILNPALLKAAIPWRYAFVLGCGFEPLPDRVKRGWRKVLGNSAYVTAAERWVAA